MYFVISLIFDLAYPNVAYHLSTPRTIMPLTESMWTHCHTLSKQVMESWTRTLPYAEGRCITAMHRKFHPEHFVCSYCLKQLNSGTFKEASEKPYCRECFIRLYG